MRTRAAGFTLIELMAVVAIIGLLASMAIPSYQDYVKRAKIAEAFSLVGTVREAVADYYAHHGRFPGNNAMAGLINAADIDGRVVSAVEVHHGAIHVRLQLNDTTQTLSLRPAVAMEYPPPEILVWVCGYGSAPEGMQAYGNDRTDIPATLLPPQCQAAAGPPSTSP